MEVLFHFRVESLNEPGHNRAAICAFEQRFFEGDEEGVHFWTHSVANVRDLGFPIAVMENADEGLSRAGFEMLLLAELHELRAGSEGRITDIAAGRRFHWGCLKFICHNES